MASKSKILIIGGTGHLEKYIVEASARAGHQTFVLLRDQTFSKAHIREYFKSLGVNVVPGNMCDHESLVNAIKQVDVVISAVGHRSHSSQEVEDQLNLVAAIKEAGNVKRFFPSEFGFDVDRVHAVDTAKSLFQVKSRIRRVIEEEGIPYTIVSANYFARTTLPNFFQGLDLETPPRESVAILGNGTPKGVFNTEEDIAMYTIKAVDDPRTLNKILYIRPPANIYSLNELVSLWEHKIGKTMDRIYVTEEQLLNKIQEETDALRRLILAVAYSAFVKGDQTNFEIKPSFGVEGSVLYPDVEYTSVGKFLDQYV